MNNNITNEKVCKNCRYYYQHYVKGESKFQITSCGHCVNDKCSNRKKKLPTDICELWEDNTQIATTRKEQIANTLSLIYKRLDEISNLLKDES